MLDGKIEAGTEDEDMICIGDAARLVLARVGTLMAAGPRHPKSAAPRHIEPAMCLGGSQVVKKGRRSHE